MWLSVGSDRERTNGTPRNYISPPFRTTYFPVTTFTGIRRYTAAAWCTRPRVSHFFPCLARRCRATYAYIDTDRLTDETAANVMTSIIGTRMRRRGVRSVSLALLLLPTLLLHAPMLFGQADSTQGDSLRLPRELLDGLPAKVMTIKPQVYWLPQGNAGGGPVVLNGSVAGYSASPAATLGVTVGGAQDIGFARLLINTGKVPNFIDFPPEGLYSEHDIPPAASDCADKLCLSLGYGFAPAADTKGPALFVHLGMTSGIRPEDFKRPPLQLALVVDRSGSMKDVGLPAVKKALTALVERLGPDDVLALVAFSDSARVLLPATQVRAREKILKAIEGLAADGGTNIEAGLELGFRLLDDLKPVDGYQKRVILFTDARANAGRTDSGSFRALTQRYADRGVALTAFGVGLDFGQEMIYHISRLRGGNFVFLETPAKIARVFDTEFDYLVTPVVHDLTVRIETPTGLKLTAVYGLPTWKPGSVDAELHIPTLFLSSRRGAIVLRYERDGDAPLAFDRGDLLGSGTLRYVDPDGSVTSRYVALRHDGEMRLSPGMQYYTHEGMRTAVALTNMWFGLRDGCRLYSEGKAEEAIAAIRRAALMIDLENLTLRNPGLKGEAALLERLATNIEAASQPDTELRGDPEKVPAIQGSE